jgi:hypothetical protein
MIRAQVCGWDFHAILNLIVPGYGRLETRVAFACHCLVHVRCKSRRTTTEIDCFFISSPGHQFARPPACSKLSAIGRCRICPTESQLFLPGALAVQPSPMRVCCKCRPLLSGSPNSWGSGIWTGPLQAHRLPGIEVSIRRCTAIVRQTLNSSAPTSAPPLPASRSLLASFFRFFSVCS